MNKFVTSFMIVFFIFFLYSRSVRYMRPYVIQLQPEANAEADAEDNAEAVAEAIVEAEFHYQILKTLLCLILFYLMIVHPLLAP